MKKVLDLHYRSENPLAKSLSNLYPYTFNMDGYMIKSMEGFLQSLKTDNTDEKIKMWGMHGVSCWKYGQQFNNWKDNQILYWDNYLIYRHSEEYDLLIQRAYDNLLENDEFYDNLKKSIGYKLSHSMGKTDKSDSLLTKYEYIDNMNRIRDKIKTKRFFNLFEW